MDSILTSIKKQLGIMETDTHFDPDIIMYINTELAILNQIGVGPEKGFMIKDAASSWNEFVEDETLLGLVTSYIYVKVRLIFDPPTSSAVIESMKRTAESLEWRILVAAELAIEKEEEEVG